MLTQVTMAKRWYPPCTVHRFTDAMSGQNEARAVLLSEGEILRSMEQKGDGQTDGGWSRTEGHSYLIGKVKVGPRAALLL